MATSLDQVIKAARGRNPAFYKTRVPSRVVGDYLSDYQNELLQKCLQRDRQYCRQSALITLQIGAPLPAGAGSGVGEVGTPTPGGGFETAGASVGNLIDVVTDPTQGAKVLQAETVAGAPFNATTIKSAAAAWTVNQFQGLGAVVVITDGQGAGQVRDVVSNTATVITISTGSDGLGWATIPNATSLFAVVIPVYQASGDASAFLQIPAYNKQLGYLVNLDASGNPYVDVATPIVLFPEVGCVLPANSAILGGRVMYTDLDTDPLTFVTEGMRDDVPRWPACFTRGDGNGNTVLFCCGRQADWLDATQLEVYYTPIAPPFTALAQYFLLPDAARPCLVAQAASFMAQFVETMPEIKLDASTLIQRAQAAELQYLSSLRLSRSTRRIRFREGEV